MNELAKTESGQALLNPFQQSSTGMQQHVNAGTVAIEEQRAIAEVKGKLSVAKMFPRNQAQAFQDVMDSCRRPSLAKAAIYSYPRGGQTVSGPSIRLAEELARCWGNIDYGIRELSRNDGMSEMEAYCWDMQTNTISSQKFTVKHLRDKQGGAKELTDERDIYEITANMGGRRMRARILAILPPDLVDAALQQCKATLAGNSEKPVADRVRDMIGAFNKMGINAATLEKYVGHPLTEMLPDEFADLTGIYNSLRDGQSKASDWFGGDKPALAQPEAPANDNAGTKAAAAKTTKPKAAAPAAEAPAAESEPQATQEAKQEAQTEAQAPALTKPADQPAQTEAKAATGDDLGDVF